MATALGSVSLVRPDPAHAQAWLGWRREAASRRFNPMLELGVRELAERLATVSSDLSDRRSPEHRWMVSVEGDVVGTVAVLNPSFRNGHAEIGYMLAERVHGRGVGKAAVTLLVEKIFRETALHRLFATVSLENEPSQRLLRRLGFQEEGRLREHFVIEGRYVDELVFGLLRGEWNGAELG